MTLGFLPSAATLPDNVLFSGREPDAKHFIQGLEPYHYVYALCHPTGAPFYIGKGQSDRLLQHVQEARHNHKRGETNPHKCNKIRKIEASGREIRYAVLSTHDTHRAAEEEESRLITVIGRAAEGGPLTNLAPGRASALGLHPESLAKHAATLAHDPDNLARDPETRALNELMRSVVVVKSTPLKPRSRYRGAKVRQTTGTTRSKIPKLRSAGALAVAASLSGGSLEPGAIVPRCSVYSGIPAILENGVSNDIIGTSIAEIIPSEDPVNEQFRVTPEGARIIRNLLGRECLTSLSLID